MSERKQAFLRLRRSVVLLILCWLASETRVFLYFLDVLWPWSKLFHFKHFIRSSKHGQEKSCPNLWLFLGPAMATQRINRIITKNWTSSHICFVVVVVVVGVVVVVVFGFWPFFSSSSLAPFLNLRSWHFSYSALARTFLFLRGLWYFFRKS